MKSSTVHQMIRGVNSYIVFFMTVAFAVSCSMVLFVSTLAKTMGLQLTQENIALAAKLTFGNVILLTLLYTIIDRIRRIIMIDRPVKKITAAAEKIMAGDFSVRIPPMKGIPEQSGFHQIADCLNRMAGELAGMETLRNDFIANVSHELKTPLAVMGNYAALLQCPGITEEERTDYARSISDASRRLAQLITNILKLNKLENQQIFPSAREFDLGEQLCGCLLQFEEVWEEKGLQIETEIQEDVRICSDEELLNLVWNNLISNAVKFTSAGGTVGLSMHTEGSCAVISVRDTGCGIRAETGRHIFEKFYQGDASHAAQGNGLGLALVKRVVDILHGEITVQSIFGEGSTFTVRIPQNRIQEK